MKRWYKILKLKYNIWTLKREQKALYPGNGYSTDTFLLVYKSYSEVISDKQAELAKLILNK